MTTKTFKLDKCHNPPLNLSSRKCHNLSLNLSSLKSFKIINGEPSITVEAKDDFINAFSLAQSENNASFTQTPLDITDNFFIISNIQREDERPSLIVSIPENVKVSINISGNYTAHFEAKMNELILMSQGNGEIDIEQINHLSLFASGNTEINIKNVQSANLINSGNSETVIRSNVQDVNAEIKGNAEVRIKGSVTNVKVTASGNSVFKCKSASNKIKNKSGNAEISIG